MKARIKGTNIIFDVEEVGDGGVSYDIRLVEFIDSVAPQQTTEPDWNQIKIQAAIAATQGLLANHEIMDNHTEEAIRWTSEHAALQAESLITELKKQMK